MNPDMRSIARYAVIVAAVVLNCAEAKPPIKIVGGHEAVIAEFPYMASLRKFGHHRCGGTIISNRHILTAAHCVNGISDPETVHMTIMTGSNSIGDGDGVISKVETITAHPDYSHGREGGWTNDIAVLTLENEIEFGLFTRAALLPDNNTAANLKCVASGWGDVSYPWGYQPGYVRKAEMTTTTDIKCAKEHSKIYIHDSQLCASAPLGVGLCSGDSGGPLVHNGVVVGIASFVVPCGHGIPDVFTRVWSYRDFIRNAMENA